MNKIITKLLFAATIMLAVSGCNLRKSEVKEIDYSLIPYAVRTPGEKDRLGYMDTKGNTVIEPSFTDAWLFSDGLAQVRALDVPLRGFIDKTGKIVIPTFYDNATMFFNERAFVHAPGQPIACINTTGKVVFELPDIIEAGFFGENLAPVCDANKKWGYVNTEGEMVIKPQYDDAQSFSEGLAAVRMGDEYGYINHEGQYVINPQFYVADAFSCGYAQVKKTKYSSYYDYINQKGKIVSDKFEGGFNHISENKLLCVYGPTRTESKKMIIRNHRGDSIASTQYFERAGVFSEGLCWVEYNKKSGFINTKGLLAVNPIYDNASNFHEGVAVVAVDGKYGLIDTKGNYIVEPQYFFIGSAPHFKGAGSESRLKTYMYQWRCKKL